MDDDELEYIPFDDDDFNDEIPQVDVDDIDDSLDFSRSADAD